MPWNSLSQVGGAFNPAISTTWTATQYFNVTSSATSGNVNAIDVLLTSSPLAPSTADVAAIRARSVTANPSTGIICGIEATAQNSGNSALTNLVALNARCFKDPGGASNDVSAVAVQAFTTLAGDGVVATARGIEVGLSFADTIAPGFVYGVEVSCSHSSQPNPGDEPDLSMIRVNQPAVAAGSNLNSYIGLSIDDVPGSTITGINCAIVTGTGCVALGDQIKFTSQYPDNQAILFPEQNVAVGAPNTGSQPTKVINFWAPGDDIETPIQILNGSTQILSGQQPAIPDAIIGTELATINLILAMLRAHGLIAT